MNISQFLESTAWKKFMAKLYGIGASIVIVGALFKIMHWPGAGAMLTAGLLIEAAIFFVSAFEPLHEEWDWSLVFPVLGGLDPEDEIDDPAASLNAKKSSGNGGGGLSDIDRLLLQGVDNDEQLFEKLGAGLKSLTDTAASLADISGATVATQEYTKNIKNASSSIEGYTQSTEELSYSVNTLSDSYKKLSDSLTVDIDFSTVNEGNAAYNDKLGVLNKNLTALNAIFELQLEGGLDQMMDDLSTGVEASKRYRSEMEKLGNRLEKLNTVYGNMLSAMNVQA